MNNFFKKGLSLAVAIVFCFQTFLPSVVLAQSVNFPTLNFGTPLSASFSPAIINGLKVNLKNPFELSFLVNTGEDNLQGQTLSEETTKLIKYFLTALTIPEEDLWVNLSPHEKNRIISKEFEQTDMGRDLLLQDYLLKQVSSALVHPDNDLGKEFWKRVYKKSYELYGTTEISADAIQKIWIVPEKSVIYENGDMVFVAESSLKVMTEKDYKAIVNQKNIAIKDSKDVISQNILKEIVIPELEKEVNSGKNFANLRQIYHSLILAVWFKQTLKESILASVYADQNKVAGIESESINVKEEIYDQYLEAYKKGVCDLVKVEYDEHQSRNIPRKYFTGGFSASSVLLSETLNFSAKNYKSIKGSPASQNLWADTGFTPVEPKKISSTIYSPKKGGDGYYLLIEDNTAKLYDPENEDTGKKITLPGLQENPNGFPSIFDALFKKYKSDLVVAEKLKDVVQEEQEGLSNIFKGHFNTFSTLDFINKLTKEVREKKPRIKLFEVAVSTMDRSYHGGTSALKKFRPDNQGRILDMPDSEMKDLNFLRVSFNDYTSVEFEFHHSEIMITTKKQSYGMWRETVETKKLLLKPALEVLSQMEKKYLADSQYAHNLSEEEVKRIYPKTNHDLMILCEHILGLLGRDRVYDMDRVGFAESFDGSEERVHAYIKGINPGNTLTFPREGEGMFKILFLDSGLKVLFESGKIANDELRNFANKIVSYLRGRADAKKLIQNNPPVTESLKQTSQGLVNTSIKGLIQEIVYQIQQTVEDGENIYLDRLKYLNFEDFNKLPSEGMDKVFSLELVFSNGLKILIFYSQKNKRFESTQSMSYGANPNDQREKIKKAVSFALAQEKVSDDAILNASVGEIAEGQKDTLIATDIYKFVYELVDRYRKLAKYSSPTDNLFSSAQYGFPYEGRTIDRLEDFPHNQTMPTGYWLNIRLADGTEFTIRYLKEKGRFVCWHVRPCQRYLDRENEFVQMTESVLALKNSDLKDQDQEKGLMIAKDIPERFKELGERIVEIAPDSFQGSVKARTGTPLRAWREDWYFGVSDRAVEDWPDGLIQTNAFAFVLEDRGVVEFCFKDKNGLEKPLFEVVRILKPSPKAEELKNILNKIFFGIKDLSESKIDNKKPLIEMKMRSAVRQIIDAYKNYKNENFSFEEIYYGEESWKLKHVSFDNLSDDDGMSEEYRLHLRFLQFDILIEYSKEEGRFVVRCNRKFERFENRVDELEKIANDLLVSRFDQEQKEDQSPIEEFFPKNLRTFINRIEAYDGLGTIKNIMINGAYIEPELRAVTKNDTIRVSVDEGDDKSGKVVINFGVKEIVNFVEIVGDSSSETIALKKFVESLLFSEKVDSNVQPQAAIDVYMMIVNELTKKPPFKSSAIMGLEIEIGDTTVRYSFGEDKEILINALKSEVLDLGVKITVSVPKDSTTQRFQGQAVQFWIDRESQAIDYLQDPELDPMGYIRENEDIQIAIAKIFETKNGKGFGKTIASSNVGGIDFAETYKTLNIKVDTAGSPLPIRFQNLDQINLKGLVPVIFNFISVYNLPELLGMSF